MQAETKLRRVLHLMQCTYLGGTEQTAYALMRGLQGRGYDFTVCSMHPPGDGAVILRELGIPLIGHEYRGRFGWRTHDVLRRTVRAIPADLTLVTAPTLSGCAAVRHVRNARRILTVHYHHGDDVRSRWKWRAFYHVFGRDYARITFLTDFIRREAEAVAPHLANRFRTVRAPVSPPRTIPPVVREEIRRAWGLPAAVPVIVNAGQLIDRKRWDVFLNVAARVARRERDAHFLIAGDGPARAVLESRARQLGIGARTRFVGWQRDTESVYAAGDLLLFNSDADAFGRTPLEAMAAGLPVVASVTYGGTDELIEHGRNGILLKRHDEGALADHVQGLLRSGAHRAAIVRNGLDTVRRLHSCEAFLTTYARLFEEVLG